MFTELLVGFNVFIGTAGILGAYDGWGGDWMAAGNFAVAATLLTMTVRGV